MSEPLRVALERLQWSKQGWSGEPYLHCPACYKGPPSEGHADDCWLLAALVEAPSEPAGLDVEALLSDERFRAAVDAAFAAPGEFGPGKGYYGADTEHFLDMVRAALAANPEDRGMP